LPYPRFCPKYVLSFYFRTASQIENTEDITYPCPEPNVVNPNEKTTQLAPKSSPSPPTEEQPQHPKASPSEEHASYSRLELERQLSVSLAARDQRIAQLADEVADLQARLRDVRASLLSRDRQHEKEHANMRAKLEANESVDLHARLGNIQARLGDIQAKFDESLLSRDRQHEKELANMRSKFEANESKLVAVQSRLTEKEKDLAESKAEAVTLRAQAATDSVKKDEGRVTRMVMELMERVRVLEAETASKQSNEKSIEFMECRNED
jgi:uncharacterized protein involved in exopolysaccharide biosynthesis